jgi:hypothetical protein
MVNPHPPLHVKDGEAKVVDDPVIVVILVRGDLDTNAEAFEA